MKSIIFALLLVNYSYAFFNDDYNLFKAQNFEKEGQLKEAINSYNKIDNQSDQIKYNLANLYYKNENYEKAISLYNTITDKNLEYKKLHNLGNSYTKTNALDKAIESYEKALTINNDSDTKHNLDLLKEKQQQNQQDNKENKKDNQEESKDSQNKDENNNQQEQNSKEKQDSQNTEQNQENQDTQKNDENNQNTDSNNSNNLKQSVELSDMEEKRWNKQLEKQKINTLLMPIQTKGEKNNEKINPW